MVRCHQKIKFSKNKKIISKKKILRLAVDVMCLIKKKRKLMIFRSILSFLKAKEVTLNNLKKLIVTQLVLRTILCQVIL